MTESAAGRKGHLSAADDDPFVSRKDYSARSCRGRGPALGAPLPARLRQSGLGCTSLECSQDSCGERLRPGPGLFLAALTAGPGRRLAVPQRLAFSVQSLVEPSVSALRYMVRSCPRIKMGGGWEGAIWKRRRILSSFGPALHTPLSPLSYLGLWVIFATLCSKHAWAHRGVEDTCPSPSVINGYAFLRLQVEACSGNRAESRTPVWPHRRDRGPCSGNLRLNQPGLRPAQGRLWDVQSSCAELVCRPPSSLHHPTHTLIPLCSYSYSYLAPVLVCIPPKSRHLVRQEWCRSSPRG